MRQLTIEIMMIPGKIYVYILGVSVRNKFSRPERNVNY
jgi:hypothetical protein